MFSVRSANTIGVCASCVTRVNRSQSPWVNPQNRCFERSISIQQSAGTLEYSMICEYDPKRLVLEKIVLSSEGANIEVVTDSCGRPSAMQVKLFIENESSDGSCGRSLMILQAAINGNKANDIHYLRLINSTVSCWFPLRQDSFESGSRDSLKWFQNFFKVHIGAINTTLPSTLQMIKQLDQSVN